MEQPVPAVFPSRGPGGGHPEAGVVDAVLSASRSLGMMMAPSPAKAAEETTIAQYRVLKVLSSSGPQRMADLAAALGVAPSTAGRLCDRLVRKDLISRHRSQADRRAVLVSVTAAGLQVVDQATAHHRVLIEKALCQLPAREQRAVATALQAFAGAASRLSHSGEPAGADAGPRQQG